MRRHSGGEKAVGSAWSRRKSTSAAAAWSNKNILEPPKERLLGALSGLDLRTPRQETATGRLLKVCVSSEGARAALGGSRGAGGAELCAAHFAGGLLHVRRGAKCSDVSIKLIESGLRWRWESTIGNKTKVLISRVFRPLSSVT